MSLRRENRRRELRRQQKVDRLRGWPEWPLVVAALKLPPTEGKVLGPVHDERRLRALLWRLGLGYRLEVVEQGGEKLLARRIET